MKTLLLLPALALTLSSPALADSILACKAVGPNAYPIEHVSLAWGEALPDSDQSPFFRHWSQKVIVTISGPRYFRTNEAVAVHSSHSTRLGEEHSISVKLSENDRIYLREYPEYFNAGRSKLKSAGLVLNENTPDQKNISLHCE